MRTRRRANGIGARALLGGLVLAVAGCTDALGLGDFQVVCTPGEQEPCYSGTAGTEKVGLCHEGSRTCLEDGSGFGACEGEVLPQKEDCSTEQDESCNGPDPNEKDGCVCKPGKNTFCYDGPIEETEGPASACHGGIKECAADGLSYGPCVGEVLPAVESCREADGDKDLNCDGVAGCGGEHDWSNMLSGPGMARVYSVVADNRSSVVVVGVFNGQMSVGNDILTSTKPDAFDVFVVKLSPSGKPSWARRFGTVGGVDDFIVLDATIDSNDNVVIAGTFGETIQLPDKTLEHGPGQRDLFVLQVSPDGEYTNATTFGGGGVSLTPIAASADGESVLAVSFSGELTIQGSTFAAAGLYDTLIATLSPTLTLLSATQFSSESLSGKIVPDAIAIGPQGDIVLGGSFSYGDVTFGGPDALSAPNQNQGLFVVRLDKDGNHTWSSSFGSDGNATYIGDVAVGPDNEISIAGISHGMLDFGSVQLGSAADMNAVHAFAARITADNELSWVKDFTDGPGGVASTFIDDAGNILISTGNTTKDPQQLFPNIQVSGTGPGTAHRYLLKFAPAGELIWGRAFGQNCNISSVSFLTTADTLGHVYYAGAASAVCGTLNLGGSDLLVDGLSDVAIARFLP